MSRGILDTSILIATDVAPIPGELAISIVSIAELQFGVLVATDQTRPQRLGRRNAKDLTGLEDMVSIASI